METTPPSSGGLTINTGLDTTIGGDVVGRDKVINVYQSPVVSGILEIADISFANELVLDIKLRNASNQVAFIKSATLTIQRIWQLSPVYHTGALILPSANYDLDISVKEVPYSVTTSISQAIPSNDVDRFTLTLSCPPHCVFLSQLTLIYDSDNKELSSGNLIFAKHGSSCSYPTMTPEGLAKTDEEVSWRNEKWQAEQWREKSEAIIQNNSVRDQTKAVDGIRNETIQHLESA
jgi:hypothetical protein